MRNRLFIALIMMFLVSAWGCGSSVTPHKEMYSAPNFKEAKQEKSSNKEGGVKAEIGDAEFQGSNATVEVKGNANINVSGQKISASPVKVETNDAFIKGEKAKNGSSFKDLRVNVHNGTIKFDGSSMKVENSVTVTGEKADIRIRGQSGVREALPEKMTNIKFRLAPRLDVADSAFLYDLGIKTPSYSWKAVMWEKIDGDWEIRELQAVRMRQSNGPPQLLITIPRPLKAIQNNYLAVVDHAGNRIFNRHGEFIMKDYRDISPTDYSKFLDKIGSANPLEVKKGSKDYESILNFYEKFRVLEAIQFRNYVYKQEGIPTGTALSKEEVERIAQKYESHTEKLKQLFLDDWYLIFTYPLLSPVEYGSYIMISKVFQIPSVWWKKNLDSPGYMDRKLTAAGAYDMMRYYIQNHVRRSGVSGTGKLTKEEQKIIKQATGQTFSTYGEYLKWINRQNKEIERYNQQLQ